MLRQLHVGSIIQLGIFAYVASALPYWRKVSYSLCCQAVGLYYSAAHPWTSQTHESLTYVPVASDKQ